MVRLFFDYTIRIFENHLKGIQLLAYSQQLIIHENLQHT